jgi:hypothetical protein
MTLSFCCWPAATPDHPQAHAASSCGRPSGGLRSSRIPDAESAEHFDADWQVGALFWTVFRRGVVGMIYGMPSQFARMQGNILNDECVPTYQTAKRDLAAAGDALLTPRSSVASPTWRQQRRHSLEAASAGHAASEAYFTPWQQPLPQQAHTLPVQGPHSSNGERRSAVQRQLLMDSCRQGDGAAAAVDPAAGPWPLQAMHSGSPPAAASRASAFYAPAQRVHSAELAAAEARADALEQKLSCAGSFIAQLLQPRGSGSVDAGRAADSQRRRHRHSNAAWPASAAADDDGLLHRLHALAAEAADVSRPAVDGAAPSRSGSISSRPSLQQHQLGKQHGRRSRLGTASRELPPWTLEPGAAAGSALPAAPGADDPDTCVGSGAHQQQRPGSPLAAMQEAVQQMGAVARRVRAAVQNPAGVRPTAAAAGGRAPALPGGPCSAGRDVRAATGLDGPGAVRTALVHARMDMAAAAHALAARGAEAQRLPSPFSPPLLGC